VTIDWHVVNFWLVVIPAALAAYLLVALYVYAPLKVRRKEVKPLDVHFDPVEIPDLPADVSEAFFRASRDLAAAGFRATGTIGRHNAESSSDSFVSVWINPSVSDAAQIIGVLTPSPMGGYKVVTLVTFGTEFTDRTEILTGNSPSPSVFPSDPLASYIRCPGVWDCDLLYRFHQARVRRDARGRIPTLERIIDPVEVMRIEHTQTFERLIAAGYYALNTSARRYEPTLKGAYLMTYKLLPPFKQIQKLRRDRLADRTLRELGFGGLAAFGRSQRAADFAA
jgi:hypothetical protein